MKREIIILGVILLVGAVRLQFGCPRCWGKSCTVKAPQKTISGKIVAVKTLHIAGMHSESDKHTLERELNALEGAAAEVNLTDKTVFVKLAEHYNDAVLQAAVERSGFSITKIE